MTFLCLVMSLPSQKYLDYKDATSKQIFVDVFSKPTNSFTYEMPFTCFRRRNIDGLPLLYSDPKMKMVILEKSIKANSKQVKV